MGTIVTLANSKQVTVTLTASTQLVSWYAGASNFCLSETNKNILPTYDFAHSIERALDSIFGMQRLPL